MKIKWIRLTTLLIFVMSVVYLGHVQNSFGLEVSEHPPEFYVDDNGESQGGKKEGPNGEEYKDPREYPTYSGSSGNGTESASSWKMVYEASGLINGGHKENHPEHKNKAAEMVYGVRVDLSASAGNSSCSGSAMPGLTDDMGLTADNPGWSGSGRIELLISEKKDAHRIRRVWWPVYFEWCQKIDVEESGLDTKQQDIEIRVQKTTITDKKSGGIEGGLSWGPASVSATWSTGSDVAREGLHAYAAGISATLTSSEHSSVNPQLDKTADAEGDLGEEIRPDPIQAVFDGVDCDHSGS